MKRKIILLCATAALALGISGCGNKDMFDTVHSYDYALVTMPDGGVQKIEIKSWIDYEDSDQLQITATDGTVYLVHSTNCILVKE